MATKTIGGGSSAVAASSHAACPRFRGTDPLITSRTRRTLAETLGFSDEHGGIPEARWTRAITFEGLVRDVKFASELTTTAVGRLRLDRPTKVVIKSARLKTEKTAKVLAEAHERAIRKGEATMIHTLAIPFAGFEQDEATAVKPDFAVVAPVVPPEGDDRTESWLIMGDAKDYERHRSRIDDGRLLKGFLQVALGAESAAVWSKLPVGMSVHSHGALAVPRNSFLQPEAQVEDLTDHREEVRMRVQERIREEEQAGFDSDKDSIDGYVEHLVAEFDPGSCASCTLYSYCRNELRQSPDATDLLVEIGVPPANRAQLANLVNGGDYADAAPGSLEARVRATVDGVAQRTGQARVDQAGQPRTVNVVLVKSDSAALGVYGIATQRVTKDGAGDWNTHVFKDPLGPATRRKIMKVLGEDLIAAMTDRRKVDGEVTDPVHLVVPDAATADLLASIADNLAGIELSRLRWERDLEMERPALTYNGDPADIPKALPDAARTAVSFLLEQDRARTLVVRSAVVDLRRALARHVVAGGAEVSSFRLDYLVEWAKASAKKPLDHRDVTDEIEAEIHTPGARMTSRRSNSIHHAFVGEEKGAPRPAEPAKYDELIRDELGYKCEVVDEALKALAEFPDSTLRVVHRGIEGDAQAIWRRRLALHASDLVRFGRTYRWWRNRLVDVVDSDRTCAARLLALSNPQAALDAAADAGTRDIASARVVATAPLVLEIDSRRFADQERIVLLHANGEACVDASGTEVESKKSLFRVLGMSIGPLDEVDAAKRQFAWHPANDPAISVGDDLVIAKFDMFGEQKGNGMLPVAKPDQDHNSAPTADCTPEAYGEDPTSHQFCCKPHEYGEAEWSDTLALRRKNGELNPDVWPPVVDEDAFEVTDKDAAVGNPDAQPAEQVPDEVTADDVD